VDGLLRRGGLTVVVGSGDNIAAQVVSAAGALLLDVCNFDVSAGVSMSACGFPRVGGRSCSSSRLGRRSATLLAYTS